MTTRTARPARHRELTGYLHSLADLCLTSSHPIKYPTIFYEVRTPTTQDRFVPALLMTLQSNYYPTGGQKWESGAKLILSNGDEWGPSFHADFHNGVSVPPTCKYHRTHL